MGYRMCSKLVSCGSVSDPVATCWALNTLCPHAPRTHHTHAAKVKAHEEKKRVSCASCRAQFGAPRPGADPRPVEPGVLREQHRLRGQPELDLWLQQRRTRKFYCAAR